MLRRLIKRYRSYNMSMKTKLSLSLGSIAAILLLSSIISILEYRRMSNYVSDLVAANIQNINIAQKLAAVNDEYNLKILASIGEDDGRLPDFDQKAFMDRCDSLRESVNVREASPMTDSLVYSYTAYMLTSLELKQVLQSDFIDSRDWYFDRLQPRYNKLRSDIDKLNNVIYHDLQENSLTFQDSYYRSIIPGIVSVGAGLLLVLLLFYFILIYYLNPLYKMLSALEGYRRMNRKYGYSFEGNDQLKALNDGIADIVEENIELKRRNKKLRSERDREIESDLGTEVIS